MSTTRRTLVCSLLTLVLCTVCVAPAFADEDAAAAALAQANNPLANMTAFNTQNYYRPTLYGVADETSNTTWLRFATGLGRWFVRISAPFQTVPPNSGSDSAGLGDIDAFAAYSFIQEPSATFGVGPLIAAPTGSSDSVSTGKWQGGLAAVYYGTFNKTVQGGGLVTYQASFAGDDDRADTSMLIAQPFWFFQAGGGTYFRSSAPWIFDLENERYLVPFGVGIGKVIKSPGIVFNLYFEPQFTVYHKGAGQPAIQFFAGLNMQFSS